MQQIHWIILFLFSFNFWLIGCSQGKEDKVNCKAFPLIVGMELSYPPFEMLDLKGNPAGVSVKLAEDLARFLGRDLKVENIPYAGLIPALQGGRIDLVISSLTLTPQRAKAIDFSIPYGKIGIALLVPSQGAVKSWEELDKPGKKIAVKAGTTGHVHAAQKIKQAEILVFDRTETAVLEIAQGRLDGFLYDQISVDRYAKQYKKTTEALLDPLWVEEWAIGVKKGNDLLAQQVNAFLVEYKKQGGFSHLGDLFLKESKTSFAERGISFIF